MKNFTKAALIITAIFSLFIAQTAFAVDFRGGDEIIVSEPSIDDLYIGGGLISIDEDVDGDLVVAGGSVTVNGNISGDLIIAGGQLTINGNVGDDIRAAGGSIFINGNVGDDVITSGGQLNIDGDSLIGGSLIIGTSFANISGSVNEDLKGVGVKVILTGTVYGDVDLQVQDNLTLTKNANIGGNLIYTSLREADLDENQVAGFIEFNKQTVSTEEFGSQFQRIFSIWKIVFEIIAYISLLAVALVLILVVPQTFQEVAKIANSHPWRSLGLGFIIFIVAIAAAIITAITVIGIPIAGLLIGVLAISLYLAKVFASMWIGNLILRTKKMSKPRLFGLTALGGFIITVIGFVPFIGWLLSFLVLMLAFGASWNFARDTHKKLGWGKVKAKG